MLAEAEITENIINTIMAAKSNKFTRDEIEFVIYKRLIIEQKRQQAIQLLSQPGLTSDLLHNISFLLLIAADNDPATDAALANAIKLIDNNHLIADIDFHFNKLGEMESYFATQRFIQHSKKYLLAEENNFFHGDFLEFLLHKNPSTFKSSIISACEKTIRNTQVDINLRMNTMSIILNHLNRWTFCGTHESEKEIFNAVVKLIKIQTELEPEINNILPMGILTPRTGAMTYFYNTFLRPANNNLGQKVQNDTNKIIIDINKLQQHEENTYKAKMG